MSSEQYHPIDLQNYEAYFVLYLDNELTAAERQAVEAFVAQHPAQAEELSLLMATKLSPEPVHFAGKADLLSTAMKATAVDEALLLYIDGELPATEQARVAQRIETEAAYAAEHAGLLQAKLDATEVVLHPNKAELYRHEARGIDWVKGWMRAAAVVLVLLLGALFFAVNRNERQPASPSVANNTNRQNTPAIIRTQPALPPQMTQPQTQPNHQPVVTPQQMVAAKQPAERRKRPMPVVEKGVRPEQRVETTAAVPVADSRRQPASIAGTLAATVPTADAVALNKTITRNDVTTELASAYTPTDTPLEAADTGGDFKNTKRTSAKGLFRKVSRFIGRNTGIGGIVSGDNDGEVLIGALALKRN